MSFEPNTLVKMQKAGGPVTLRLTFDGLGADWSYTYVTEGGTLRGKSTDGGGPVRLHPLGAPADLHAHAHTWDLAVGRTGADDVAFSATLTWEQDLDGNGVPAVIHVRRHSSALDDANEADVFRSGVFLLATADVQPVQA